jgi:hypothetical protein
MRRGIPFEQGDPLAVLVVRDPMRGCSVEGCPRPFDGTHNGREFCYFHYHRDYRGTPLSGPVTASAQRQRRFGKARRHLEWIIAHADSFSGVTEKVEDCHIWWYRRTGNGYAKVAPLEGEKGGDLVCRIICYRVHGDPPSQACQAGHICDRGHLGCVNPKHLEWQTHSEQGQARSRNYARKRAVALAQIPS